MRCPGCSGSRDGAPRPLHWWARGEGRQHGQLPTLGRAARLGTDCSSSGFVFFLFNGFVFPFLAESSPSLPTIRGGGVEGGCLYYKFPIFLIKLYRYSGNQIPSSIFLA